MKVVCIKECSFKLLTINKIYEATKVSQDQYYIKDNSGEERWYNYNRFKDMAIVRQEKLKQIGI